MARSLRFLVLLSLAEPLAAAQFFAALQRRLVVRHNGSDALLEKRREAQSHAVDLKEDKQTDIVT